MKVVISGMGAQCALGSSIKELWDGIEQGNSGIVPIQRFDVTPFETKLGGMVPGGDQIETDEKRLLSYALKAANEALHQANINDNSLVSLVLGTSNGVRGTKIYSVSYSLADELNLGGLVITVSTACTSSSHAIGFAADLIRRGHAGIVLAGGVDILTRDIFAGFYSLGLLSKTPCSPFSNSLGTTLGEGAAFVVIESEESAKRRGIQPQAVFMGYGITADAFHDTQPDQSGTGVAKAIINSLGNSNLKPSDIDYLNAHGTGTAANDSAEWRGIQRALADHSIKLPISSSKSFYGHAQGAAGALEAVTTIIAMQHHVIPPTLNYIRPRPFSPVDPVASDRPRPFDNRIFLSTNSGFGGVNSALVFGREDVTCQPQKVSPGLISVLGYASNMDEDYISQYIPYDELRGIDLSAKLLAGVIAMILNHAGIEFRSNECDNIGLFVGLDHLSAESLDALDNSIKERGIRHLSASAFTRLVINYPAGVCCRLFGMKGPVAAIAAKPDNGMTALCLGADFISMRDDTDLMIVASVDEWEQDGGKQAGAFGLLLKAGDEKAPIRFKGWSISRNFDQAAAEALKMAGLRTNDITSLKVTSAPAKPGLCTIIETIENMKDTNQQFSLIGSESDANCMGMNFIIENKY